MIIYVPFILLEASIGISMISILFNSILDFAILLECNYLSLTIITASKMFCKTEDQIVHFTSLQLLSFVVYRFGRLIRELRALPMATTPGGENNLLSAIFFRILYVPHSKMFNFQTCNFL